MKINLHHSSKIVSLIILFAFCTRSTNAQWVKTNTPATTSIYCFAVVGSNLFAGVSNFGGGTVLKTVNTGITWAPVMVGLPNTRISSLAMSGSILFAGTPYGVFYSQDSGREWNPRGLFFSETIINHLAVSGTLLFAVTSQYIGQSYDSIFVSNDSGLNWKSTSFSAKKGAGIICLGVVGTNIFAGIDAQGVGGPSVFLSTNNGMTWVNSGLPDIAVESFAIIGKNIFTATTKGVFLSTDNGTTWIVRNTGLNDSLVLSLAVVGTNIFAGTYSGGVFISTNYGTNWTNVSLGLMDSSINTLSISDSYLFAGMYDNGGIWRRPLSEMITVNSAPIEIAPEFIIEQNIPNPFSTTSTMHYKVSRHEHVQIILSNLLGQKLVTLLDKDVDAGDHDLKINANDIPNGVYVVTITADGITKSQKISVQK